MTAAFRRLRPPRARLAAALLTVTSLVTLAIVRAGPAEAYTVERTADRIVVTSKRMDANTVHLTVTVRLYSNGNWEFRYEGRNGARIAKVYWADAKVWSDMYFSVYFQTGERAIDGTWRSNPEIVRTDRGYNTWLFHNWERVASGNILADFHLRANRNGGIAHRWECGSPNDTMSVCSDPLPPPSGGDG